MTEQTEERFWSHVQKGAPDECWEWTTHRNREWYGTFRFNGRNVGAHRVAYMLTKGPIPDGLLILHSCDNPPCVNPAHLRAGTSADNINDMGIRGRNAYSMRTHCPQGHAYEGDNLGIRADGARRCRTCVNEARRKRGACPHCGKEIRQDGIARHIERMHDDQRAAA